MVEVILGIGGNTGDRLKNLLLAGGLLADKLGAITAFSPIVESEPWGFNSQNWFLNQILILETSQSPGELIETCLAIEEILGRKRTDSYSDRIMDIDILFYGNQIITDQNLTIPHPRLHLRSFILKPLENLRPELIHPIMGLSVKEMLESCTDTTVCNWFRPDHSTVLLP